MGGVAVDEAGNVVVADTRNHCVRKVTPQGSVTTVAGSGQEGFRDGPAEAAQFARPMGRKVSLRARLAAGAPAAVGRPLCELGHV